MKRKLTDRAVRSAKPKEKAYKLSDGGGLYLYLTKSGVKSWRYDYSFAGKRQTLTFGVYPIVGLADARDKHTTAIFNIKKGIDPRIENNPIHKKLFSEYAIELLDRSESREITKKKKLQRLRKYCFAPLDKIPIDQITTINLYEIIRPILIEGKNETARVLVIYMREVFSFLRALHIIEANPANDLKETLVKPSKTNQPKHMPFTIDTKIIGDYLKGFEKYQGNYIVQQALMFMPLVFLRPRNIRELRWSSIDFENKTITYIPEEMKKGRSHIVPLSIQALAILKEVKSINGDYEYVFTTATGGKDAPMVDSTLSTAMNRIINPETNEPFGKGVMSPHGWRHTASTLLNEMGFNFDAIEAQLGHQNKDSIRATYNKAQWIPERTKMMQSWADYLDTLKGKNNVILLRKLPDK